MRGVLEAADDAASACLAEPSLSFVLCCSTAQDEPQGCWWQVLLSLGILQDCTEGDQTPRAGQPPGLLPVEQGRGTRAQIPLCVLSPHRVSPLTSWGSDPETSPWSSPSWIRHKCS